MDIFEQIKKILCDQLDLDDEATDCEKLHEQAEKLYQKLQARLDSDITQ